MMNRSVLALALCFFSSGALLHAEQDVFMTLTRTPWSEKGLPTTAETAKPETFSAWAPQSAGDIVARLTSVQVQPTGGLGSVQTVKVRGSTTNENMVLIDGRPVGGTSFASSQDLSEIPVEQIDHIEVVRGGISALYGPNAMGGVLNIVTKRAPLDGRTALSAGYDLGSYGRNMFRGSVGAKQGPVDYFLSGSRQDENGFRDNSSAGTTNFGGNAGVNLGAAGKLTIDGSLYQANTGIPGQFFPAIATNRFNNETERRAVSPNADQQTDSRAMRLAYKASLPMNSLLTMRLWGSSREVLYKDPDSFVDTDRVEQSKGGEAQLDLPLGLVVGGSFLHDREDSQDHITPANSFIRSVENYAFFAQETLCWKMWTLIPSGRFDHHSQFGDTSNPRVQLMADATPWLRFSGSAARSFRAPTIDELYYPFTDFGFGFSYQGNPNLKPERAWTYDGGFELHDDRLSFRATYFRANVTNLIQTTLDPASTVINVGSARRQGAELQLEHRMNAMFRDSVNYTYLENRGIPPGFTERVDLRYSPRHTVNYTATLMPFTHWSVDNTLRYVDHRFSGNNASQTKLGSMVLWDMRLAWQNAHWTAYLQAKNVTNRRYEEQAGYPLPGRTFLGGMSWRY